MVQEGGCGKGTREDRGMRKGGGEPFSLSCQLFTTAKRYPTDKISGFGPGNENRADTV